MFRILLRHSLAAVFVFMAVTNSGAQTKPEDFLGHRVGADFKLVNYERAMEYYALLASESDRMIMMDMGETSMGRRMKYAVVSSAENLANLARYKEIARKLSLGRDVTKAEAEAMSDEGKAIVWVDAGLHATEVAPPQHHIQFAYDLVTGEDRINKLIRNDVITILVYANPDGMTIVSDWYMKNVGTPYEVSRTPELYHKYVGHDNNRDSHVANLIETQNMSRAVNHEWFPHILYNQHQTAPFPSRIWIPPASEPTNPNLHPMVIRWQNLIGSAMGKALDEKGQDGAISRTLFDTWYPGYVTQIVDSHNIPSIITETALYRYATPYYYTLRDFPKGHQDLTVGAFYPTPWKGGWWRIRDAIDYNLTATYAVLETAAKYRYEFLYNKYQMATETIEKFSNEPPYGWIFPKAQDDPNSTAMLVNRMRLLGTEVYTADADFTHNGNKYAKGSFIVPTSQPFGNFVKNVLEIQDYPGLEKYSHLWQGLVGMVEWKGAPLRPYDGVGWTLPIQFGVDSKEMSNTLDGVAKTLLAEDTKVAGGLAGNGSGYLFSVNDLNSFIAVNKVLAAGGKVTRTGAEATSRGNTFPRGSFVVESKSINNSELKSIGEEAGIMMYGGNWKASGEKVSKKRVAIYKSWVASMDGGWINFIFDQHSQEFTPLEDPEVRAGNLIDRYDVIVLPDQRSSSMINGHQKGTMPPDYVGGMSVDGVKNIKDFVKAGGILVTNNSSSDFAIEQFKLPIKNLLKSVPADSFFIPGSLLKMDYKKGDPVTFGMDEREMGFFSRASAFEIKNPHKSNGSSANAEANAETNAAPPEGHNVPEILASYPDEPLLISGYAHNEKKIRGKASIMRAKVGDGKIIMFGFNIHNRAQSRTTFKLLFNAIYSNK